MLIYAHQVKRHQGDTVNLGAEHTMKSVPNPHDSGVLPCPKFKVLGWVSRIREVRGVSFHTCSTTQPTRYSLNTVPSGFQFNKERETMTTSPVASRCAAPALSPPTEGNTPHLDPAAPTLDAFTDWVLDLHGNTFDAMDTAQGDAYREHLHSFARTNVTLTLLAEFRTAHAVKAAQEGGAA